MVTALLDLLGDLEGASTGENLKHGLQALKESKRIVGLGQAIQEEQDLEVQVIGASGARPFRVRLNYTKIRAKITHSGNSLGIRSFYHEGEVSRGVWGMAVVATQESMTKT